MYSGSFLTRAKNVIKLVAKGETNFYVSRTEAQQNSVGERVAVGMEVRELQSVLFHSVNL